MDIDFQPPRTSIKQRRRRRRPIWLLLVLLVLLGGALALLPGPSGRDGGAAAVAALEPPTDAAGTPAPEAVPPPVRREVIKGTIEPGATITALLGDYLSPQEILALSRKSRELFPLSRICAGQPYQICTVEGNLERFVYEIDAEEQLIIEKGEEIAVSLQPIEYTVETAKVAGTIESSLFETVAGIGEGPELALALSDIFAWDIDFIRDIRQGDAFQAVIEKRYREGQPAGYGRVLAAEFTNRGETFRGILFQDGDAPPSYYDPDGINLRKAFLKAPLSYSRISSGFTMRRFHPITKTWKSHPAIDYAAPSGTPIKAVGDGVISRIGYTKYNGNHIKLRHNSSYETLYLHMSRFARGLKRGQRVTQGQVIGYVGSTGLATGPHLCFRMYKNGSPVNPQRIKTPAARPVSKENLASFRQHAAPLLARLDDSPDQGTQVAVLKALDEQAPVRPSGETDPPGGG